MRKFMVNVNGTNYEVAVEEIDANAAPAAKPAAPAPAPVAAPAAKAAPVGGTQVVSPMPGTILGVNVKEGDVVKPGQALFVLEAMKMESDIPAPVGGTVKSIAIAKGASVESGTLLCTIA